MFGPCNPYVEARLNGLHQGLIAGYEAGLGMSSATKGTERELFVKSFLSQVFPPHYRFASGEITDTNGERSGQVDIVVESPFLFSFPAHADGPRLFFAESVAAIIEVKSDLKKQWGQIRKQVEEARKVKRRFVKKYLLDESSRLNQISQGLSEPDQDPLKNTISAISKLEADRLETLAAGFEPVSEEIPIYVIGFEGWKTHTALRRKLLELGNVDAVIKLSPPLLGVFRQRAKQDKPPRLRGAESQEGVLTLWRLLDQLRRDIEVTEAQVDSLANYRQTKIKPQ